MRRQPVYKTAIPLPRFCQPNAHIQRMAHMGDQPLNQLNLFVAYMALRGGPLHGKKARMPCGAKNMATDEIFEIQGADEISIIFIPVDFSVGHEGMIVANGAGPPAHPVRDPRIYSAVIVKILVYGLGVQTIAEIGVNRSGLLDFDQFGCRDSATDQIRD